MSLALPFFTCCLAATLFSQEAIIKEQDAISPARGEYISQTTPKKYVIGLPLRTDNTEASKTIPAHWGRFFQENILSRIPARTGGDILAVYTEYEKDQTKPYTMILGCEVASLDEVPEGLVGLEILASHYAVFTTNGPHPQGVVETWQTIWNGDLQRTFTADFEVYSSQFDPEKNPQVKVYIAVEELLP